MRGDTDINSEEKSRRAVKQSIAIGYTASRESNGAGGSLRERYPQHRKTTECLSTLLPGKFSEFSGRQQIESQ